MERLAKVPMIRNVPLIKKDSIQYWIDGPERILIVDDEAGIREALREFFDSLGYQTFASPDPFQALEIINNQFIHLAILDLKLPGMDGIELQKRICQLSPDTAHIIITAYESLDSAIKTLKAGAYDYLLKPVRLPYLGNVVRNCLEKKKLEMENRRLFGELHQTCEQLKEREEALEAKTDEANYYLHNILEKANDIIFTLNLEGLFTYINPKIEALGYNRDSLLGASVLSVLSNKDEAALVYRCIKGGRVKDMELSITDKMGNERQMIVSMSPIHDSSHCLTGALAIAMDITDQEALIAKLREVQRSVDTQRRDYALERERSAEEIRLLQEYNQMILSGIPIGVALYDRENNTLQANERFMGILSLTAEQIINKPLSDYLPSAILTELAPGLNCGGNSQIEVCVKDEQEQERILGLRTIFLKDHQGITENMLLLVNDLTRSKIMERELLRLERVNSMLQLATGVAHEVRNPLSIILGTVKYLQSIIGSDVEDNKNKILVEHLDVITESCGFLESIINELLNFTRPASLVFKPTDINACIERTVSLLKSRCQRQNVEILLNIDNDLPFLSCDEQHIGQVFINLIINAVQAMPHGGKLIITTKNEPLSKRIFIAFKDTGIGIDAGSLDKIFEPFFSTKSKGIGLGLAVTKRIVEDHYGKIWVTSRISKGTEFNIFLPYRSQKSVKNKKGG